MPCPPRRPPTRTAGLPRGRSWSRRPCARRATPATASNWTGHAAPWRRAGYAANPLEDGSLSGYRLLSLPLTALNRSAVASLQLTPREIDRCKNFFALGLLCWLYERPPGPTLDWIRATFATNLAVQEANKRSFLAGLRLGETTDQLPVRYRVPSRLPPPGRYRRLTGNEALALGLVAAARSAGLPLFFAAYPIAP